MVLDECIATPADAGATRMAMERSIRWARRARDAAGCRSATTRRRGVRRHQPRTGAVRDHPGRRPIRRSATESVAGDASRSDSRRYAIGGLSVGEPPEVMYDVVGAHRAAAAGRRAAVPDGKRACPTTSSNASRAASTCSTACCRRATRGTASSSRAAGRSRSRTRSTPRTLCRRIRSAAATPAGTSRAPTCAICYVAGEMTAATLNTIHNLYFYLDTMRRIREAIMFGSFEQLRLEFHQTFSRRPQH